MANNLKKLRENAGLSQDALAERMGTTRNQITKLEKGTRRLSDVWISRASLALKVRPGELVDDETNEIPIMGYVGAGAEIQPDFEQVPPEGLSQVELSIAVPSDLIGFEVEGDSMLPRFREGDVVLVYREPRRPLIEYIGHEAVVRTSDGRRFVKNILRGPRQGTVTLDSHNARPIEGVTLDWVGEIVLIVPRTVLKNMERAERAAATRRRHAREAATAGMDELPLREKQAS